MTLLPDRFWWAAGLAAVLVGPVRAADWPMWRYDAGHTANSPEKLPANLTLAWMREYSPRVPAWEDPLNQDLMPYDRLFEPIVLGERLFLAFNDRDKLVALDLRTGAELWTFHADGPIRLAPAGWQDKVYFACDDGHLYCVQAGTGRLVWKFRGGLSERQALGNGRLISAWPARGGPVIRDGTVYFAASIWPFMGTFIYALDAQTGKAIWVNDGTGAQYMKQPHSAPAFAGVAPQGSLVATEEILLVPGGRSVPAAFKRANGDFLYYNLDASGKGTGGSTVMANDTIFLVHTRGRGTRSHDLKSGRRIFNFALNEPVITKNGYYCAADQSYRANFLNEKLARLEGAEYEETKKRNELADAVENGDAKAILNASNYLSKAVRQTAKYAAEVEALRTKGPALDAKQVIQSWSFQRVLNWELKADGSGDLIRAGDVLYAAGENLLSAIEIGREGKPRVTWSHPAPAGRVRRLLAANGMLIAVTLEGHLMAFGSPQNAAIVTATKESFQLIAPQPPAQTLARAIIEKSGAREGYALCLGLEEDDLLAALALDSQLHLIGVDPDANKIERLRRRLDAAGLYGKRVALLAADPTRFGAPPYLASLMVVRGPLADRMADPVIAGQVYESLRPYGGQCWILAPADSRANLREQLRAAQLANARILASEPQDAVMVIREGALPGAADWTHQYGDVGNSGKSDDATVKLPVGLLWFGGNTHLDVLPRHGHGPSEQVAGGRLFLEGMDALSARDVYTGRRLWKTVIPGLETAGVYYDNTHLSDPLTTLYNQRHIPGANARGANFVATADKVYVAVSNACVVLDAVTGNIIRAIELPARAGDSSVRREWAYIGVYEDVLLGGTDFAHFKKRFGATALTWPPPAADLSACNGLAAFDRHSGQLLWQVDARHSFLHTGIAAGNGRVYCLDRLPRSAEAKLKAQKNNVPADYRIVAYDVRTGAKLWETTKNIFGSWLGYSKKHDLLLQAGASAADRLRDEVDRGMMVLNAGNGAPVWRQPDLKYNGPCIIHNDLIITTPTAYNVSAGAFHLVDGSPYCITNPLTGTVQPWRFYRTYGCNTPVAAENLITFRSGAAGFYDLASHWGVGNLGGFKSGCSANLIVANGVLNAPDYTRTCSCPYQNQTSLAFVPMPELEMWTYNSAAFNTPEGLHIRRLGLNFGAPGDRLAADGTLWLEYPLDRLVSPRLAISLKCDTKNLGAHLFRRHSTAVTGDGPAWVYASGVRDIRSLVIAPQTLRPLKAYALPKPTATAPANHGTNLVKAAAPAAPAPPPKEPNDTFELVQNLAPVHYTVRLYFSEPDNVAPGQRLFEVALQGRPVLTNFDVRQEAGGPLRGVMKEFSRVLVVRDLEIHFTKTFKASLGPVLSGVELILEEGP